MRVNGNRSILVMTNGQNIFYKCSAKKGSHPGLEHDSFPFWVNYTRKHFIVIPSNNPFVFGRYKWPWWLVHILSFLLS